MNRGGETAENRPRIAQVDSARGRPLTSHEVIVETIAATTTNTGLTVRAELDQATYPTGVKIPDAQMKALENQRILTRNDFHGEWNYTVNPKPRHADSERG